MTTNDELANLVFYDSRKVVSVRELIAEKARTLLVFWQDQWLVSINVVKKAIEQYYKTHDNQYIFRIGKATYVNDVLWSKVKGRGVRRAALEAEDGSVYTTRTIQVNGPHFTIDYHEKWEMGLNPGESIEYEAYETGDLDHQILIRGDVNAAIAFLDYVLDGYARPHRPATVSEIAWHEEQIADRKARWNARDTERHDTGWSDDRKTEFRKRIEARQAERVLSKALANGEIGQ